MVLMSMYCVKDSQELLPLSHTGKEVLILVSSNILDGSGDICNSFHYPYYYIIYITWNCFQASFWKEKTI